MLTGSLIVGRHYKVHEEALPGGDREGHSTKQRLFSRRRTQDRPEQDGEGARYQAEELRGDDYRSRRAVYRARREGEEYLGEGPIENEMKLNEIR